MNKPRILGVITARGGSKGLPGKNIKILGDKPLIAYSIEAAAQSKLITQTIISTDDPAIKDVAKKYGGNVPFMRPEGLALDKTPHAPVMQHAVKFMEDKLGVTYDYIVILQPTSPFRTAEDIDETLKILIESGADSAVSLVEADSHEHPIKMKKLEGDRVVPYCIPEPEGVRRQDLDRAYRRNGSVYAMKRDLIMKEGLLFGKYVVGHVVSPERSIDIDTEKDWVMAEYMLGKLNN